MKRSKKQPITIIGAGLAGTFLAILLARRGFTVDVYERSSFQDILDTSTKKSYNITFYGFAVKALKEALLWDVIRPILIPLVGSETRVAYDVPSTFAKLDTEKMPYYAVQRSQMLEVMISKAQKLSRITIHFETMLVSVDRHKHSMIVRNTRTGERKLIESDVIFGADGVNSLVRSFIQQGQHTTHIQDYAPWSYKQIQLDKNVVKELGLRLDVMHAWTRREGVFAGFPNSDGTITGQLILPRENSKGFCAFTSTSEIKKFIQKVFPDLLPALPEITQSLLENPESNFVTVYTSPWYYKDFMVILGDAAHGFLPFYGQGTSAAFGDCLELVHLIDRYGNRWMKIFSLYQERRKKSMDVIADLSKKSFKLYQRDRLAYYRAIYDRLEYIASNKFPRYLLPPLFDLIARDPNQSARHAINHQLQRSKARRLGFPVVVGAMTGIIMLYELSTKFRYRISRRKD